MLKPYQRGPVWWVKGKVEYNGRPITGYYRRSTGATSQKGAEDWIERETDRQIKCHIVGAEEIPVTFADALELYDPNPETAKHLIPILQHFGTTPVKEITPKAVRDLGAKLYPNNATDSWSRWVVAPTRAVINNAHDTLGGRCPPIRIRAYNRKERLDQDIRRGKRSRVEKTPGSWEWLLQFREHAGPRHRALALFMFVTGARIGQAVRMHPGLHLDLQNSRACVPGAKGSDDRWLTIPMELTVELANLSPRCPRGWKRNKQNLRVFGFAYRQGVMKGWHGACDKAGIEHIMPHAAGRHGFGQEMLVRSGIDEKAAGKFGGWHDLGLMRKTYTHSEDHETKILAAFRTGLVQAETETGLKLMKENKKIA